jgi:hypothetical protein
VAVSVEVWPLSMVVGLAVSDTDSAGFTVNDSTLLVTV